MGMIACYMEVDKALIEKLKGFASEHLMERIESLEENGQNFIDIDKMWDGLHFLLTGVSASTPIENNLISEAIVGEDTFGNEDDYIAYIYPDRLKEICNALHEVDTDKLKEKFSPKEFAGKEVYPNIWLDDDKDDLFEELVEAFECIKKFYSKLVSRNKGVIVSIY